MDRLFRGKLLGPVLLAAVLALGAGAGWATLVFVSESLFGSLLTRQVSESLEVSRDGQVLIWHRQSVGGTWEFTYRTLDGREIVKPASPRDATPVQLWPPSPAKPVAIDWVQRVVGVADSRPWPEYWYIVREEHAPGRGYFAMFDSRTRQSVGYFGPQGFSPQRPAPSEQFADIPLGGYDSMFAPSQNYGSSDLARGISTYLIASGKLQLLELDNRSLRTIDLPGEPIAVSVVNDFDDLERNDRSNRVVVRTADRIIVLGLDDTIERSVTIPEPIRDRFLMVYNVTAPEMIITSSPENRWWESDVYWLGNSDGDVRHAAVRLAAAAADEDSSVSSLIACAFPSPLALGIGYLVDAQTRVETGSAASVPDALAHTLSRDWPALLLVFAISATLAVWTYRRQSRYAATGAAAWAAFVLITGVPGALGYWLHRVWPVTEVCDACGVRTPRDRDGCLACAAEFSVPSPRGIEILT